MHPERWKGMTSSTRRKRARANKAAFFPPPSTALPPLPEDAPEARDG